jgi:tetratricopeptide (TPR) repeat protein
VPTPPVPGATTDPFAAAKGAPAEHPGADLAQPAKPKTYERLVGEADRLMENGQPARAQKLLDEALVMQPNGVAALSGVAYLQLDRQRPLAAISTFKRALGLSPEFPPALFGLAEAYRAQGEIGPAAENYRKYIAVAAGAPDAPAARRQLKEIESLMPKKPAPAAAPAKESPKSDQPAVAAPAAEQAP